MDVDLRPSIILLSINARGTQIKVRGEIIKHNTDQSRKYALEYVIDPEFEADAILVQEEPYPLYLIQGLPPAGVDQIVLCQSQISLIRCWKDPRCCFAEVRKGEHRVLLGSIHGPSKPAEAETESFFRSFFEEVSQLRNETKLPIIIGGDWNCSSALILKVLHGRLQSAPTTTSKGSEMLPSRTAK